MALCTIAVVRQKNKWLCSRQISAFLHKTSINYANTKRVYKCVCITIYVYPNYIRHISVHLPLNSRLHSSYKHCVCWILCFWVCLSLLFRWMFFFCCPVQYSSDSLLFSFSLKVQFMSPGILPYYPLKIFSFGSGQCTRSKCRLPIVFCLFHFRLPC